MHFATALFIRDSLPGGVSCRCEKKIVANLCLNVCICDTGLFFCCACQMKLSRLSSRQVLDELCRLLTLEYRGVLDDETFELCADNLQTRLHIAARRYLIPLLHLLGTAGWAFGLANLQICTWQEISRDRMVVWMNRGK